MSAALLFVLALTAGANVPGDNGNLARPGQDTDSGRPGDDTNLGRPGDDTNLGRREDSVVARRLLQRLESRQASATDIVARFVQSYRSGLLGREVVETGRVTIKRPGRMRWEYQKPEKKLFVSDGRTFYFYVPEDKQVIVQEQDETRSLAGRLLTGAGGLLDEFEATLDEPLEDDVYRVQLVPRREDADLERAFVDVEPTGRLRGVEIEDVQGNRTHFQFQDVRENSGVPDRLFHFEVPPGVEVIQG